MWLWLGLALILLGFALIFVGILLKLLITPRKPAEKKGALVFFIGPIPVVLASDKEMVKWAFAFTLVGLAFFILVLLLLRW